MTEKNAKLKKTIWLWLEPYVHVAVKETALLYNTLSGKKLEVRHPMVLGLLRELVKKENLLVVELKNEILENSEFHEIQSFVRELKESFMGDTAPAGGSAVKPVQMMPLPRIDSGIRRMKKDPVMVGKSIMSYITELTFYINNYSRGWTEELSVSPAYYKQFLFPYVEQIPGTPPVDLPLEKIGEVMNGLRESGLYLVNVTGGNILEYPRLQELQKCLASFPISKRYHIYYRNSLEVSRHLPIKDDKLSRIVFAVTFPVNEESFANAAQFTGAGGGVSFSFAVADESELEACEALVKRYGLEDFSIHPYYNGSNLEFFERLVFFDREGLWEESPSQKEIFRRQEMNPHLFGKLTIMSSGDIYVEPNAPKAGNVKNKSIREVVFEEIYSGESWLKTRMEVPPCNSCLYNFLCPPLSSYEFIIGRNNLCHIGG